MDEEIPPELPGWFIPEVYWLDSPWQSRRSSSQMLTGEICGAGYSWKVYGSSVRYPRCHMIIFGVDSHKHEVGTRISKNGSVNDQDLLLYRPYSRCMQVRNWKASWNFSPVNSRTALLPWHWTRSMMLQCKLYAWWSASSSEYSDVKLHTMLGFCSIVQIEQQAYMLFHLHWRMTLVLTCFCSTTRTFAIEVRWGVMKDCKWASLYVKA